MRARLAEKTGMRRAWGGSSPNCSLYGFHYKDFNLPEKEHFSTPQPCDMCGALFNATIYGFVYNTPSGELEPGCLFWNDSMPEDTYWDNHKGPHLMAITPNNRQWCIDGRASNCDMPDDRLHRCWVRHGTPPNVHVDKNGKTCNAGAGSIITGKGEPNEYHGFLHNGQFTTTGNSGRRHKQKRR